MNRRSRVVRAVAPTVMTVLLAVSARAQGEFASDAARLVNALKLGAGQTVADIGAGAGQLSVLLAREVGPSGRVYATELNKNLLRVIRRDRRARRNAAATLPSALPA
jgi:tRNA A58 N-methylase Trm61